MDERKISEGSKPPERFKLVRESSQAKVQEDLKTPEKGMVVKSISRNNPEMRRLWEGLTAEELAENYRKTLNLAKSPEFGLAEYIPPTKVQILDEDNINIVQRKILGRTLHDYIWELAKRQNTYSNIQLPPEILAQYNDIILKTLNMARKTMDYPREQIPRGVTTRDENPEDPQNPLPVWRNPKEWEGTFIETISGNALNNIMLGIPYSERNNPEAKEKLWIIDCTDAMLTDELMAEDTTQDQLDYGCRPLRLNQLDPKILEECNNLDEEIKKRAANEKSVT